MKSPLLSKTVLGLALTVAGEFGAPAVAPETPTLQVVVQLLGLALALYGRWTAQTPLGFSKSTPEVKP